MQRPTKIVIALAAAGALVAMAGSVDWGRARRPLIGPGAQSGPIEVYIDVRSNPPVCWIEHPTDGVPLIVDCGGVRAEIDRFRTATEPRFPRNPLKAY